MEDLCGWIVKELDAVRAEAKCQRDMILHLTIENERLVQEKAHLRAEAIRYLDQLTGLTYPPEFKS
jgi:hypothetical protein